MSWVALSEALPAERQRVALRGEFGLGSYATGFLRNGQWFLGENVAGIIHSKEVATPLENYAITHWRALPEGPKADEWETGPWTFVKRDFSALPSVGVPVFWWDNQKKIARFGEYKIGMFATGWKRYSSIGVKDRSFVSHWMPAE